MSKLAVKCVRCKKTWEKDSTIAWGPEDYSGSLCDACFLKVISPTIHRKQLKEGNQDCFGKGVESCDRCDCKYRDWCIRPSEMRDAKDG